jgi:hypothetical protein
MWRAISRQATDKSNVEVAMLENKHDNMRELPYPVLVAIDIREIAHQSRASCGIENVIARKVK